MKVGNDVKSGLIDPLMKLKNVKSPQGIGVESIQGRVKADKVELTVGKDEINRIREKIKTIPAVRQEKVDVIRKALETGTYNIRGELVAKSLLKDHLLDRVL